MQYIGKNVFKNWGLYNAIAIWQKLIYINMQWQVKFSRRATKLIKKLPNSIQMVVQLLAKELETSGPTLPSWPNYGKLKGTDQNFHCHLIRGKPTYVACWEVIDKQLRYIEVYYVGTHENAPY